MSRLRLLRSSIVKGALLAVSVGSTCLAVPVTINEFPVPTPSSSPSDIASGPDGNLWFTEANGNKIGRITTAGVITEFAVPTAASGPSGITSGPDGNVWFTEVSGNKIGRITTAGVITEFLVPTAGSGAGAITSGPDGNLWFTEGSRGKIGRISISGALAEFTIPTGFNPAAITSGPDGNLWFTENGFGASAVGRITTAGVITEFVLSPNTLRGITSGSDGNLWFTERWDPINNIDRITTGGTATVVGATGPGSGPFGICSGPDGNLWFTEGIGNKIGRITTAGIITVYTVPTASSWPRSIASGPDGNLWFTEQNGNNIGQLVTATTQVGPAKLYTLTPCRVIDTRNADGPLGGPILFGGGATRLFTVTGTCGIPTTAKAVAANISVTGSTYAGDVRLYAGDQLPSGTSGINFSAGQTRANNAVQPLALNGDGSLGVQSDGGSVHFILDVSGYFE